MDEGEWRRRLEERLEELDAADARGRDGEATVMLDQQAVGRLSRMDALQGQAMAKAGRARRETERRRVSAALARLEVGEFGYCTDCGETLEAARLAVDPAVPRCASCTRG